MYSYQIDVLREVNWEPEQLEIENSTAAVRQNPYGSEFQRVEQERELSCNLYIVFVTLVLRALVRSFDWMCSFLSCGGILLFGLHVSPASVVLVKSDCYSYKQDTCFNALRVLCTPVSSHSLYRSSTAVLVGKACSEHDPPTLPPSLLRVQQIITAVPIITMQTSYNRVSPLPTIYSVCCTDSVRTRTSMVWYVTTTYRQ